MKNNKFILSSLALLFVAMQTSCRENEFGTVDLTMPEEEEVVYVPNLQHPGILHSQASINAMKQVVAEADGGSNAYKTYEAMRDYELSQSTYFMNGPYEKISRDDADWKWTKTYFEKDFSAAYLNALMWNITGDEAHAAKALEILTKYADTLKEIPQSNDAPLLAGLQGFQIICATELLRYSYDAMTQADKDKIDAMLRNVFLPIIDTFYATPAYTNGNWGIIATKFYMGAAILWDDVEMYQQAVDFFFNGNDNGTLTNYIDGETGQNQESGRDQGHSQLGIGGLAEICEVAYVQGNDLYAALDNRLLKGYEYLAKYNLGYDDVPFKTWQDVTGKYSNWTKIGSGERGAFRAIYAIAYNHYVMRKGEAMPYTSDVVNKKLPMEGYDADNIGFGTFRFCDGSVK